MSNFPSYMSFFLRSYNNVSHQNFQIQPASSGVLQAHRQMQFTLPTNAMLHLSKTRLMFTMSTAAPNAGTAGRLAAAKSILDRVEISAGGVSLSSGCAGSSVLAQCIDNMRVIEEDPVTSHCELYRRTSGVNGRAIIAGTEAYTAINSAQCFAIELGPFFATLQPNMLPTQILPTLTITAYLSGNASVVSSCALADGVTNPLAAGTAQSTYSVDNYTLQVSAYSLDDGVFDQTLATRLNSSEGLEATFCNYESFSNTFSTGSTAVSSAASSLDKVIVAFRASGFDGVKSATGVKGYNNTLAAGLTKDDVLDQPAAHGGAKYLNATSTFSSPTTTLPSAATDNWAKQPNISIQVNNVRFPSYDARIGAQTYELLKEAFEVDKTAAQSLVEYVENRCQLAYKFNLPASQAMRARSGLNLQGSNSQIRIEAVGDKTGVSTDGNIMVFVESTVVLKIMGGKQILVVS